jgi:hypothetical protein
MADQHTELLIAAIREFRTKAQAAFELAKTAHQSSMKDAEQTVAAANEFIEETQLFWSALRMHDKTQHYHAWCARNEWDKWNVIGVTNVKTYGDDEAPNTSAFTWGQHAWAFSLTDVSYTGDSKFGTLSVECDGQAVMEVRMVTDFDVEYDSWRLSSIRALVVGPWVAALTEMATKMELAEQHRWLEMQAEQVRAQAARIKL